MTSTHEAAPPIAGVGTTALFIAALRAAETGRPDALITGDPLAVALVATLGDDPATRLWLDASGRPNALSHGLHDYVAMRTCYFDDHLTRSVAAGARQVVLLGSGMDGRAYRMRLPGATIFEVDTAEVEALKRHVVDTHGLTAVTPVRSVESDLRDPGWPAALVDAGFDPAAPSAWLAEGLLFYLAPADCDALLGTVGGLCAPGSTLATEYPQGDMTAVLDDIDSGQATREMLRAFVQAGPQRRPADWLGDAGWTAEPVDLVDWARPFGRTLPDWSAFPGFTWWFATADRGEAGA